MSFVSQQRIEDADGSLFRNMTHFPVMSFILSYLKKINTGTDKDNSALLDIFTDTQLY